MKVIPISEAKPYNPPRHHDMVALKLCDAQWFWCGLSHFLPEGGAEWAYDDSPTEKLYVILDGAITIRTKEETRVVSKGEAVFLAPFEGREVVNHTNYPASMLVIASNA
ncbi:cupin domain-containing protein [Klebsiella pneumoniae]|uniref:cupin domain-containing protein n=1 Tax=Klebsiella pneumoniae TaxID=573 RepID=UPI00203E880F|nr:cupin domain-containing protein [Klebsiella pneumoniae]USB65779.1 cupin domain-containing protein [Klebsiella pneumoniae]HBT4769512.1 cupin domain-containing protein [Klebsiella variicola subsp. variicola]HBT4923607.1 cupin domain-containing protein [Klebsiella pneumoniae]HCB1396552.1 cupin domain-containing protein [Klebsiella pneumoniae]